MEHWIKVFEYALASGPCKRNSYAGARFQAAFKVNQTTQHPTINKDKLPQLLRDIDVFEGYERTKLALKLSAYISVRKMELFQVTWNEIDLEASRWVIPSSRIKTRSYDLIVDLPTQALDIMRRLKELSDNSHYLFPAKIGKRHMDKITPAKALNYLVRFIEGRLSHIEGSKTRYAYCRCQHLEELPQRKAMLQDWANYLDAIKAGAEIVPFKAKAG